MWCDKFGVDLLNINMNIDVTISILREGLGQSVFKTGYSNWNLGSCQQISSLTAYFTEIRNLVSQYLHLTCLLIEMSELIHPSSTAHHICIWCWMKTCKIAIFNNTQNKPYIFSLTVNNFYLDQLDCQKIFNQIRI